MEEYLNTIAVHTTDGILSIFNDGGETSFVSVCDKITKDYRNPAAHTGTISRPDMIECYNKIVEHLDVAEHEGRITGLLVKLYSIIDINKLIALF